jgi:hypothetical protein
MSGDPGQQLTCNLGVTGKMIRRVLVNRTAPPGFREALRRQLFENGANVIDAGAAPHGKRFRPDRRAAGPRI